MPPVSPLTIGLADFLSQQRAPAVTGALQGGPEGVKILQSLIAANAKQDISSNPLFNTLLSHMLSSEQAQQMFALGQGARVAGEQRAQVAKFTDALTKASNAFIAVMQGNDPKIARPTTQGEVVDVAAKLAAKVGNGVDVSHLFASKLPGMEAAVASGLKLRGDGFTALLRNLPYAENVLGPAPQTMQTFMNPPASAAVMPKTAAQAVTAPAPVLNPSQLTAAQYLALTPDQKALAKKNALAKQGK